MERQSRDRKDFEARCASIFNNEPFISENLIEFKSRGLIISAPTDAEIKKEKVDQTKVIFK